MPSMWTVNPQPGDSRVIEKFAFLPIKIEGEAKWLCRVKILQQCYIKRYPQGGKILSKAIWFNVKFL